MNDRHFDVIFAGGGLAATLTAYRLRQLRPDLRLCVLEAGEKLGGKSHLVVSRQGYQQRRLALDCAIRRTLLGRTAGALSEAFAYANVRI